MPSAVAYSDGGAGIAEIFNLENSTYASGGSLVSLDGYTVQRSTASGAPLTNIKSPYDCTAFVMMVNGSTVTISQMDLTANQTYSNLGRAIVFYKK